jgi:hypothetical protein
MMRLICVFGVSVYLLLPVARGEEAAAAAVAAAAAAGWGWGAAAGAAGAAAGWLGAGSLPALAASAAASTSPLVMMFLGPVGTTCSRLRPRALSQ